MRATKRVKIFLAAAAFAIVSVAAWTGEGKAAEADYKAPDTGAVKAAEEADYRTPDIWSEHTTPGGFADLVNGIKLTDAAVMNIGLTSRYVLRTASGFGNDSEFFQYLRANIEGLKLGGGTVYGNIFVRAASDLNRNSDNGVNGFHFYKDILDAEISHNKYAARLYQGNITLDGVIPLTKLTGGRLYTSHINNFQLDGGDLSIGNDKVKVYGYGGAPVSFFYNRHGDDMYGGGLEVTPLTGTKLAGEYTRLNVEGLKDNLWNIRLDKDIIAGMHLYGVYTNLNSRSSFDGGLQYRIESTKTYIRFKYRGLYKEIDLNNSWVVNPLTVTLLPYGKYNNYNVELGQGIGRYLMVSGGVEIRDASGAINFDNRSYKRYYADLDVIGLPDKDTYISIIAEKWDLDKDQQDPAAGSPTAGSGSKTQISGRLGQKITKGLDLWAGTSFNKYAYDQESNRLEENARNYYVGAQWVMGKAVSLLTDLSLENSDAFNSFTTTKNNYKVEAWLNLVF